ncbi:MAG TPA: SPW repeat protein [Streptosporangiaceae bacterium]
MSQHPDIVEMRARYDRAAQTAPAQTANGLIFLSGLYLAVSPWVVGFNGLTTLTVNNLITGVALAVLALGFAAAYGRTHGVAWVTPLVGVWTIITPWVVSGDVATTSTVWSNVVTGAVAAVFGIAATTIGMVSRH